MGCLHGGGDSGSSTLAAFRRVAVFMAATGGSGTADE